MAQRKKAACDVALNDKIFKNIKHEGRKRKYKRKIKMLKGKVQHLQEALEREQNTYNLLWDACDARGLICSICLEDIVQQSALPCCSNSMCKICEDQVAEKHQRCPFCRAPMTPSQSVLDRQREQREQQQQQQQQPLDDYFRAIGFGQMPDADVGSDDPYRQHQHSAMAALQGFLAQQLALSMPSGAACPDEDLSDDDYSGYGSEDEGAEDGYEGMEQPHWDGTDNTVLYAAAAEAVAAARAGPSGNCGLCDDRFLLASLASTEELPGILVCRHCWRNMPGLSDTPFPAGRTVAPAAERLAMGRSADNASPPPPPPPAAAAAADAREAQPIRAAALAVPTASTHLVAGSSKPSKHKDKHKRKHNAHAVPRSAAAKDIGGSSLTSSHHKKRQRHADAHNVPNHARKKQQDQQQLQEGSMPLKKKVKKAMAAGASTAEPTKKVAVRGCGVAAPIGSHSSKRSKNKQKSLPGHKGLQISGQSTYCK